MGKQPFHIPEIELYKKVHKEAEGYNGPIRVMGIESGGVYVAQRLFNYLSDMDIPDLGVFSVDVSRCQGRIRPKEKERLAGEVFKRYPGFLEGAFLFAVDDVLNNGRTKEIVDREVDTFFRPALKIGKYKYCVLVCNSSMASSPDVIYAGLSDVPDEDALTGNCIIHINPVLHVKSLKEELYT